MTNPTAIPESEPPLSERLQALGQDGYRDLIAVGDRDAAPADRRPDAAPARPLRFAWPPLATAMVTVTLLVACQREAVLPPLPPAALNAAQTQALQQMNAAGATAFAGWTWRYEFGAGCRLRVSKRYEDRPVPATEYVLTDHVVELVPYAASGFGVKAYPRLKPGSVGLFDAASEPQAQAFATEVRRLLMACDNAPASSR